MSERLQRTLQIEARLKVKQSISSIARDLGVSRTRVQQINKRLLNDYLLVTATPCTQDVQASCTHVNVVRSPLPMKSFTVTLTPSVHDALVEACAITNRQSPADPITIAEYTEELIINKAVELGLLRKRVM